jgi:hypothetical protein
MKHRSLIDAAIGTLRSRCWYGGFGALTILACAGPSDDETVMAGPTGSGHPAAEFLACFGFEAHDRVDALEDAELVAACRNFRACDAIAFSEEEACRFQSTLGAKEVATDATSVDELRSDCAKRYQDCVASPDAALAAVSEWLEVLKARECRVPADCAADFGDLADCASAMRQTTSEAFPDCGSLTADIPLGEAEIPQLCDALGGDCIDLLLAPGE